VIEVHPNLWIGSGADYNSVALDENWAIVSAAKEPWHRDALGYTGQAAPKSHPEYLMARRGRRLICNLVDAPHHSYFSKAIVNAAIKFVADYLAVGCKVLIHCNEGRSRSCLIGMLYLASIKALPEGFEDAQNKFRALYHPYNPGDGARSFLSIHYAGYWDTEDAKSQELAQVTS